MIAEGPLQQLLAFDFAAEHRLRGFIEDGNETAVYLAQQLVAGRGDTYLCFWGPPGSGKTHLLRGICREVHEGGATACYLDFSARRPPLAALDGLERAGLVALDAPDTCFGDQDWEVAIFHLFNRLRAAGGRLVIAVAEHPRHLAIGLEDLKSRLTWGAIIGLTSPDEAVMLRALHAEAARRGLTLPERSGRFLLRHHRRDMHALMATLDTLDQLGQALRRGLTVPFLKETLGLSDDL